MTVYGRCGACYNGAKKANNNENAKRGAAFFDRNGRASLGVFACGAAVDRTYERALKQ